MGHDPVGLPVVVVIANQAPKWLQKQGLKVGLPGPTEESLAALAGAGTQAQERGDAGRATLARGAATLRGPGSGAGEVPVEPAHDRDS